jgi:hypothetical protein
MHRTRLVFALVLALVLLAAPLARGTSTSLVVTQVYGGGGNSGATYANDFVELLNRGSTAVDLSSWTLQYATSSGTSWQTTALAGSVQPGHYYLVELASGGTAGAPLPAADATGTSNLAASGGKIALVHDTAALTCGATAGSCSSSSAVTDLVGYGSATDFEGTAAAPALSSTTAALRAGGGCTDTEANDSDFATAPPTPRNAAAAVASCGSQPTTETSQNTAVDLDIQPVLSIALEHPSLSFGHAASGDTPAALSDHVTVSSNNATGYALTVHRSIFAPTDLPLAIAGTAPGGAQLGGSLAGGALVRIPVPPAADLLLGTSATRSATGGDVWATSLGFASALPVVAAGHYTATVTFTVVGQ